MIIDSYFLVNDKHNIINEICRLYNLGVKGFILHSVICNKYTLYNILENLDYNISNKYNFYITLPPNLIPNKDTVGVFLPKCLQNDNKEILDAFEKSQKYNLPLFIHYREGWHDKTYLKLEKIKEYIEKFRNVKVVINGINYSELLKIINLFYKLDNVLFDISMFQSLEGLKILIEYFSDERIIFGTGAPINNPIPNILKIRYSTLSKKSLEKICYSNILSFLNI